MDLLGPLPESRRGNKYLLVVSDYFTRWVEAYPLPNSEAIAVAQVFVLYNIPFSTINWFHLAHSALTLRFRLESQFHLGLLVSNHWITDFNSTSFN
jgi:hypothetical protein